MKSERGSDWDDKKKTWVLAKKKKKKGWKREIEKYI